MARFTIVLRSPRPARAVFAQLVDWDAHSAAVPLTRLEHDGEPRVGQRLVARTALRAGLGRLDRPGTASLGFDDPMEVRVLRPPPGDGPGDAGGRVEVVKLGRVIAGWVHWTVTPGVPVGRSASDADGSVVEWTQELTVPWLPRWVDPVVGRVGRVAYRAGLRRMLGPDSTAW